jgi:hypothetical protein
MKAIAPVDAPIELAPELASVVNAAVEEMETLIQKGRLQNDPLRFPIVAEQVFLRAFYKVALDLVLKITSQRMAPVVVPDQEWRRIAAEMGRASAASLGSLSRRRGFRDALLVVAGLFIALGAGTCGGWWWRGDPPALQCQDQADGSRVCYTFERLATKPAVPKSR